MWQADGGGDPVVLQMREFGRPDVERYERLEALSLKNALSFSADGGYLLVAQGCGVSALLLVVAA